MPYPGQKPEESGNYVVSIRRPFEHGEYVFNYVSHYDRETDCWFKKDLFDDEQPKGEEITQIVVGWIAELPNYLG